jgi:hypothetical protein
LKDYLMTFDERFKEYLRLEEEKQKKEEYFRRENMAESCNIIIKEHHERMKDDPEHLTTNFLLDITGCKCNKKENDEKDTNKKRINF